jgi:serine/threonine-protein kinase
VPPELEQVVMWALNKNPADRPTDADQFINALEAAKSVIQSGRGGQRTASMAALAAVGGVGAAYGAPAAGGAGVAPETAIAAYRRPAGDDTGSYYVEQGPQEPPPDEPRIWPWVTLLLILLLAGGGVAAYLVTRPHKRVVPTVTNQTLNTARTILQNDGFTVSVLNVTNNKPAGIVIGQDPQGNDKAKDGSTVTLTVSQGPGSTTVPSVVGLSQKSAQNALNRAHLRFNVQHEPSETIAKGKATRTDPGNGQSVGVGSTVTLYISSGKPMVTVPNVIGESVSSARSQLTNAGFVVTTTDQTTTSAPDGNVVDQTPAGNAQVAAGSTVSLVVAKAPTTAQVPDVTGDTAQGATNALKAAGFKVTQKTKPVTKQNKDGIVLAEQPNGGSTQNKGSTVTITVGKFTPTTTTTPTTPSTATTTPTTSNTP